MTTDKIPEEILATFEHEGQIYELDVKDHLAAMEAEDILKLERLLWRVEHEGMVISINRASALLWLAAHRLAVFQRLCHKRNGFKAAAV